MNPDISMVTKAMEYAAEKHRGQSRKDSDNTPYINHPISLAHLLAEAGSISDTNVIVAALLHDTVEDTDATLEDLEEIFGNDVTSIVMEVTDDKSLPSPERKQRQIETAAHISYEARLVKLADKICNLQDMLYRPPVTWSLQRKREYFDWAKQVIDQLRGTNTALEDIFDKIYQQKP